MRQFYAAAFSRDGRRLAAFGTGGVWVYDLPDGEMVYYFEGSNAQKGAFSPNGSTLMTSIFNQMDPPSLYDLQSEADAIDFLFEHGAGEYYTVYTFSPDNRKILIALSFSYSLEQPNNLLIVDRSTLRTTKNFGFGDERLTSLAVNPFATLAAVGHESGAVTLVDLEALQIITTFDCHIGPVNQVAFSADGRYLVTGGADGVVKVWGVR